MKKRMISYHPYSVGECERIHFKLTYLNPFRTTDPFMHPWKYQRTSDFVLLSWGIEWWFEWNGLFNNGLFLFFNSFMTEVPNQIETSLLICRANKWTGFYMIVNIVMKEIKKSLYDMIHLQIHVSSHSWF